MYVKEIHMFSYTEYRTFIMIFMKSFVSSVSFYCRHTKCVVVVVVKIENSHNDNKF